MDNQKVLEAMSILKEHCHGRDCTKCFLCTNEKINGSYCKIKQSNPSLYKLAIATKKVYVLE